MKRVNMNNASVVNTFKHHPFNLLMKISNAARLQLLFLFCPFFFLNNVSASLVVNEIDYDQPGTDNAEFIELFNNGPTDVYLGPYHVNLVGSTGSIYQTIQLGTTTLASGQYLVICGNNQSVSNCDIVTNPPTEFIQNGIGGIGLYDASNVMIDGVGYESNSVPGFGALSTIAGDSDVITGSLSRLPNGVDTGDGLADWAFTQCISPGASNCTAATVPVPAAVWLFGTGLIGLSGIARYRKVG